MRKKNRKTFYNWLTNRYQLIIRNEENFAEKTTIGFNYARVIALGFIFFVAIFVASLYFGKHVLSSWYEPDYIVNEQRKQLANLAASIDEMKEAAEKEKQYVLLNKLMLSGGEEFNEFIDTTTNFENLDLSKFNLDSISYLDRNIRAEYSQKEIAPEISEIDNEDLQFLSPIDKPKITKKFNVEEGEYKILVEGKLNDDVVAVLGGKVLAVGNNSDIGNFVVIQHSSSTVTKITGIKSYNIKDGELVKTGQKIAVAGDGDSEKGQVVFELLINSNPVDPLPYIKL